MRNLALLICAFLLASCGKTEGETPASKSSAMLKNHYYEVKDGTDYGYETVLSENARSAGQAASPMMMFSYAGERNGKHQVHTLNDRVWTAFECSNPCELLKILSFVDLDGMREQVTVERMKFTQGTIAYGVLTDAFNGRLEQYVRISNKKETQPWIDEKQGPMQYPLKK
jgi:hypothetical protein